MKNNKEKRIDNMSLDINNEVKLVFPTIELHEQAIDFIADCDTSAGTCGLYEAIKADDYDSWINAVVAEMDIAKKKDGITPALTYFYMREHDHKIIGIVKLKLVSGEIEFCVRKSERRKHNAINMVNDIRSMGALLGAATPVAILDKSRNYSQEETAAQVIVRLCGGKIIND